MDSTTNAIQFVLITQMLIPLPFSVFKHVPLAIMPRIQPVLLIAP